MNNSLKISKGARSLDPDGLSVKERIFVGRFLIHGERARASREAGLSLPDESGKFRRCAAWNWPRVRDVIDRELALRRQRYKLESDWVLEQLAYMVRFDPRKLVDENNSVKPLWELDEATAVAIAGFEVKEEEQFIETKKGERIRKIISRKFTYKLSSRNEAMLMAMKHLKLLGEASAPPPQHPPVLVVQFVNNNAVAQQPKTIEAGGM